MSAVAGNDFRRKWDRDEYERKAQERINSNKRKHTKETNDNENNEFNDGDSDGEKERIPKKRENLKAREFKVDLESKLGKTVVISKATPSSQAGGFHCPVCDCVVKDSINYLDHINGKKHQKNLGMNMRISRSTLEDVKERFAMKLREKEEKKKEYNIEEKMKELKEEEEKLKAYRKQKRKEKQKQKHQSDQLDNDDDNDMATLMGFSSFSTKKK